MKPEDVLHELRQMFAMTSRQEQLISQILGRLWQSARDISEITDISDLTGGSESVDRVDTWAIRYTIPNI